MNERFKELLKQATEDILSVPVVNQQLFAELVVQECANFVQYYYKDHACEGIAQDMKKHFGIGK